MKKVIKLKRIIRKPKKVETKKHAKILSIAAVMLTISLIVPGICIAENWVPPPPDQQEPRPDVYLDRTPIPDREIIGVPPEKLRDDHICSPGNLDGVYLQ